MSMTENLIEKTRKKYTTFRHVTYLTRGIILLYFDHWFDRVFHTRCKKIQTKCYMNNNNNNNIRHNRCHLPDQRWKLDNQKVVYRYRKQLSFKSSYKLNYFRNLLFHTI